MSWLPRRLPAQPKELWKQKLSSDGLGGIAATKDIVIVGCRDILDRKDVFFGIQGPTGKLLWQVKYAAPFDEMDYGKSPRATPLIVGKRAVMLGALGHLTCVNIDNGEILWQRNFVKDFGAQIPTWGFCGSPIMIDGRSFVVQPGAKDASLVAINILDGSIAWQTKGREPSYSSFILATLGGRKQLVGYDQTSLGGWDPVTGERLWEMKPAIEGDFNVPSPIALGERLFVTTENNGSRLYEFGGDGKINPRPVAQFESLAPDTHSPVVVGDRIVGICDQLFSLDSQSLKELATIEDEAFKSYCSAVGNGVDRVLVTSSAGQLVLVKLVENGAAIESRARISPDEYDLNSHPALVGSMFYFRRGRFLICLDLAAPSPKQQNANLELSMVATRKMRQPIADYIKNAIGRFDSIAPERKAVLQQVAKSIHQRQAAGKTTRLTFVCTHNSRRSHFAQIWAAVAATHFGVRQLETYSGGTEVTSCNTRTIGALRRAGFDIPAADKTSNPKYKIKYSESSPAVHCYSKLYRDSPNPSDSYIAMMCCGDADERCPVVEGADERFSIHYVDPKVLDGTASESATYDERCLQIATEMFYLVSLCGSK